MGAIDCRWVKLGITFLMCASLAACETVGDGGGSRPSRNRSSLVSQTDDYRRTIVEGAFSGALIGGAGAALITAVAGGSGRDVGRNALIGAAVGGLIGTAAGKDVADRKQQYVEREDELASSIRQAQSNNAKLSRMVGTARALLKERRAQASAAAKQSASAKRELASAIGADENAISSALSASDREISQLESLKSRYAGATSIDHQINAARSQQKQLSEVQDQLGDVRETIK